MMKPYLLALIIFISCSKETIEKPVESISMTQTRLMYNEKNQFVKEHLVIHFHRVDEPAIIEQYKNLPAAQAFCYDQNDTLVTVLGKVCKEDCGFK